MPRYADRVKDTTTTSGTGNITLAGSPPTGYQAFGTAFSVNDFVYYFVEDGSSWEVGLGKLSGATTLERTYVYASTNSNAAISLSGGTATVACDIPARFMERLPSTIEYGFRGAPFYSSEFTTTNAVQGPFLAAAISAGTFTTAPATANYDGNNPGIILIRSSTTANSGASVITKNDVVRLTGGEEFNCYFRTPNALTSLTYRLGFHDATSSTDAVDGAYFEMPATGNIVGKTSSNSTRTTSATIATLATNTWYHARIVVNSGATAVDFYIYSSTGTQLGTVQNTTNIPTAAGRECGVGAVITNSGTTAADCVMLDYMSFCFTGRQLTRGALF